MDLLLKLKGKINFILLCRAVRVAIKKEKANDILICL
jgi:hypothetical protein